MPSGGAEQDSERDLRQAKKDRERLAEELRELQTQLELVVADRRTAEEQLGTAQEQLTDTTRSLEQSRMAEMALHFAGAFPKFYGDPTKDRSFKNFLGDYKLACDRFGFDEKKSALWLSNSLKGHALNVLKEVIKADPGKKEKFDELTTELDTYFKPLTEGKKNMDLEPSILEF